MEKMIAVLQIIVPIFTAIFLGVVARRRNMITPQENSGLQKFVIKFAIPCVLFNSCLNSNMGAEALTAMGLLLPLVLGSCLWAFKVRKTRFRYHNFPMMFTGQESGMLGIPLFMTLFGAEQAYRVGVLDITQALVIIPVLAILTADVGADQPVGVLVRKVFQSPLLIMGVLGLVLNLSGAAEFLNSIGVGAILFETTSFIAQPVSAVMLFSVGYTFSLNRDNLKAICKISALHFGLFAAFCLLIQGVMCLLPAVDALTRWAVLIFCTLPPSYLSPGLGKTEEEHVVASGVCSLLTVTSLIIFCIVAVLVV